MRRSAILFLALLPCAPLGAAAQSVRGGDSGARTLLPVEEEIALARSAAPGSVSGDASIWVLGAEGYRLAVEGPGAAACYVSRDWRASVEPHCFDSEGAATIMRMHMHRVELLHAGVGVEDADRAVATGLAEGRFRLPRRPAMSWMMSSAQKLVAPDGREVGAWRPHVMIYYPFLTAEETGMAATDDGPPSAMLADGGSAFANVVVVVPAFVDPEPVGRTRR
jgi:hypothetical protein